MACYHPLPAYQCASGEVVFAELSRHDIVKYLWLPCGQCIGCRLERSRQWAMRCMHEASLYEFNCFVTLTYDDKHLPYRGDLCYPDFQKFMKRLRKVCAPAVVRFYMCGEYGPNGGRPHYHACLFNCWFSDRKLLGFSGGQEKLYSSEALCRLWPDGFSSVGDVTFASAAYCARYCMGKVTGHNGQFAYLREDSHGVYSVTPEFNHMSLKPGIGRPWLDKFYSDVYPRDFVVVNGKEVKPPKYYDLVSKERNEDDFELLKVCRELEARAHCADNTNERLVVRETVTRARIGLLKRNEVL